MSHSTAQTQHKHSTNTEQKHRSKPIDCEKNELTFLVRLLSSSDIQLNLLRFAARYSSFRRGLSNSLHLLPSRLRLCRFSFITPTNSGRLKQPNTSHQPQSKSDAPPLQRTPLPPASFDTPVFSNLKFLASFCEGTGGSALESGSWLGGAP